jgi:hypothetical protein
MGSFLLGMCGDACERRPFLNYRHQRRETPALFWGVASSMRMVEEGRAGPRPCTARQKKQEEHERRQQETPPHPKRNITVLDASENTRKR